MIAETFSGERIKWKHTCKKYQFMPQKKGLCYTHINHVDAKSADIDSKWGCLARRV